MQGLGFVIQTMVAQPVSFSDELEFFDEHGKQIGKFTPSSRRFCIGATGISNDAILVKSFAPNDQVVDESLRMSTRIIQSSLKHRASLPGKEMSDFRVYVRTTPGSYTRVALTVGQEEPGWFSTWKEGNLLSWYRVDIEEIRRGAAGANILKPKESLLGRRSLSHVAWEDLKRFNFYGFHAQVHPLLRPVVTVLQ